MRIEIFSGLSFFSAKEVSPINRYIRSVFPNLADKYFNEK